MPPAKITADSRFTSTVRYRGTPTVISDSGIPRIPLGWQRQITGTFVASEPSGAMNWYPVNNHPRDKASYTFRITVPGPYQVAANGVLVDRFDAANGATKVPVICFCQPSGMRGMPASETTVGVPR